MEIFRSERSMRRYRRNNKAAGKTSRRCYSKDPEGIQKPGTGKNANLYRRLVGYFSYDYIKYSEPKLELTDKTVEDFRDMDLMLFDQVIAFDHYRQKVLLITGVMTDDLENSFGKAEKKLQEMADLIRKGEQKEFPSLKLQSSIEPQFPKEKYCEMVETARHYIREGDIFQVVLSNPMRARAEGSLFDTYRVLRATNPSPYMFYFPVMILRLQEPPRKHLPGLQEQN